MNRIQRIRRSVAVLAGLAGTLLALVDAAPAALASLPPPDPTGPSVVPVSPVAHVVVAGGMPGWQITLIAIGAALFTAAVAVLLDRARGGAAAGDNRKDRRT